MCAPIVAALARELKDVRAAGPVLVGVRVSRFALAGSVLTVPITTERARPIRHRLPDAAVGDLRELLVHPEDWAILLNERHIDRYVVEIDPATGDHRALGLHVDEAGQ